MGESEARTIARATLQGLLIQSLCVEKHRPLARRIAWAAPPPSCSLKFKDRLVCVLGKAQPMG